MTDVAAASSAVIAAALREFMAASPEYRQQYLQANYGIAFDGYSYQGQQDSTHQAPEDLLHTFVLSDFYPFARYPQEFHAFLNDEWTALSKQVQRIEQGLLHEIAPDLVPLHRAGLSHMLSANFYPPTPAAPASGTQPLRLSQHPDVSLLTVFPFGTDEALQYLGPDGLWHAFPNTDNMVVFAGYLLEWLSNGLIPALNHRVSMPQQRQSERLSFAVFSVPRPGIHLAPFARPSAQEEGMSAEQFFAHYVSLWDE